MNNELSQCHGAMLGIGALGLARQAQFMGTPCCRRGEVAQAGLRHGGCMRCFTFFVTWPSPPAQCRRYRQVFPPFGTDHATCALDAAPGCLRSDRQIYFPAPYRSWGC